MEGLKCSLSIVYMIVHVQNSGSVEIYAYSLMLCFQVTLVIFFNNKYGKKLIQFHDFTSPKIYTTHESPH